MSGVRIAMWSGPRNISTALLRSWGNRRDTAVCDEPLYAHYLVQTGIQHPGREEVIARHETDWRRVVQWLTGPIPDGKAIFYQKHMAHHLLPKTVGPWLDQLTHCFLIRNPSEMLASLVKHWPRPSLADTGLPQQLELLERVRRSSGQVPPVLDARDILQQPERMLRRLCSAVSVPFTPDMLHWPAGRRATDGIWARHWYAEVELSTGFEPYRPRTVELPPELHSLLASCEECYSQLHQLRLSPD